ncbi:MAG: DUF3108 domain-containing protein [Gemmatimonadota bacterium]|nr:DUF3108 domain-containing protein [Gemmatimonadota bacterium]
MIPPIVNILALVAALGRMPAVPLGHGLPAAGQTPYPFVVGEQLSYEVAFGILRVGRGSMQVLGMEDIRGYRTYHTLFTVKGGTFFFRVDDRQESWIDSARFASIRFAQNIREGGYRRQSVWDMFPDRSVFVSNGKFDTEEPSVADPLDEGSLVYFVRTIPLEVGKTYEFHRYFKPEKNPVIIKVIGKARIQVPAGTFDTFVLQPIIKSGGAFSENGEARIWITDDDRRMMVQMKSKLSFGSLNLYLTSFKTRADTAAAQ